MLEKNLFLKKSYFQILQEKILWKIVKDTRKQIIRQLV